MQKITLCYILQKLQAPEMKKHIFNLNSVMNEWQHIVKFVNLIQDIKAYTETQINIRTVSEQIDSDRTFSNKYCNSISWKWKKNMNMRSHKHNLGIKINFEKLKHPN